MKAEPTHSPVIEDKFVDKEIFVFIHGITPSPDPSLQTSYYTAFYSRLQNAFAQGKQSLPQNCIYLTWGFPSKNKPAESHEILAPVERRIYQLVQEEQDKTGGFELNPFALVYRQIRKLFLLGFADMFYYVSTQGKAEIQKHIFDSLLEQLPPLEKNERYSLTIVAHSAGCVIMQDLLYTIFGRNVDSALPAAYVRGSKKNIQPPPKTTLKDLRKFAEDGRLRLKCLITLGAPITPMIIRHQDVMVHIHNNGSAEHGKLQLHDLGIRKAQEHSNSIWLNFWDIDDVISYPLAFLYDQPGDDMVLDFRVCNNGILTQDAHCQYWYSEEVARLVSTYYPNR